MLQPGDRVGRYEIQSLIGEGAFGKVYRAWDPELERPVAIKELSSDHQAHEPARYAEYRERFRLERQVQGQFQHPHIISVHDLVQQDENEYLIEEFAAGGSLRNLIQQEGRLSPERVIQIGCEMCQAIAAAWEQDIIHRDIKPSNILLTDEGHAKLADFGVAQIGQMSQRTQSDSHHPGTPAYMSPEQAHGYGYLDERSDLYALGLVLYEALTGKPFKRERVPVRQLAPDVPKGLERVVMRALAHEPADRYQHAAVFGTALRQALAGPRHAWLWGGVGVVVLLALILGGWPSIRPLWTQEQPTPAAIVTTIRAAARTPTAPAPTSTPTRVPTTTVTATPTPSATPTLTATAAPPPTRTPMVSIPHLVSPPGAGEVSTSHLTLQWEGELPDSSYAFHVSLRHASNVPSYTSSLLDETQWTVDLPGDAIGEWRWSVAVIHRSGTQDAVARSDEWTFYYRPFGGSSSSTDSSPLPTPTP